MISSKGAAIMEYKIKIAGFGGQGILFMGKVIAGAGLADEKEVSWLPSYGPEMRGGTANCSVCISDDPIGSPLVVKPNVFLAMNRPSFDRFIDSVEPDGIVIIDSSLIDEKIERKDVRAFSIPATELAAENELNGLANMIMLGKLFNETSFCSEQALKNAVESCVPKSKQHLIEYNLRAISIGENL